MTTLKNMLKKTKLQYLLMAIFISVFSLISDAQSLPISVLYSDEYDMTHFKEDSLNWKELSTQAGPIFLTNTRRTISYLWPKITNLE